MADNNSDSEAEEGTVLSQEELDSKLLAAVKENNYEEVEEMLFKQANAAVEKDGWNPLLLAASNGNEDIVRLLLKKNAHLGYKNKHADIDSQEKKSSDQEQKDPFVKPKDASKVGKLTPLHLASYKGHIKVVWLLLKNELSALDID